MSIQSVKNSQKIRFMAVGGINTLIDFSVLFLLKSLGLPTLNANIISTTVAFCFSFFANKKFTFKTTSTNIKREIVLFVLVTLFGLWVLQSLVIAAITTLIGSHLDAQLTLVIAKIVAIITSLTWNYLLYSRVVFRAINN